MNKRSIWILVVLVGIILIVLIYKEYGNQHFSNSRNTVKIGLLYGLTGPANVWTQYGRDSAQMAVDDINAQGGVNGKQLQLIVEDSKSDPAYAVSAFQKLIAVDGVDVVIGDAWSVMTNPLIPIADNDKITLISPTVMDASVEKQSPYFFTIGHTVSSQEQAFEKFFSVNPDVKTIYNLCWTDEWGIAHTALLHQVAAKLGIRIIGESCTGDYSNDYRTEVAKVKAANPDAVFISSSEEEVAIRALKNLGITAKILTTNGVVPAVKVNHFPISYLSKVWFTDWVPDQDFINKFQKKYGLYPILESQNPYEAVRSIVMALKNNQSDINAGLKSVNYQSVDGRIDFVDNDNITVNEAVAHLYTVAEDGGFVLVQ